MVWVVGVNGVVVDGWDGWVVGLVGMVGMDRSIWLKFVNVSWRR